MATLALALAFATGCAPGPIGAEEGSTIELLPDAQSFTMDAAFTAPGDGIGLLIEQSVMVHEPADTTGQGNERPANGVQVEVISGWTGAYLIAEGSVRVVADYEVYCEGRDEDGCNAFFDTGSQQYIEFAGEYAEVADFRPSYLSGVTNDRGLMRFYVFMDSLPTSASGEGEEASGEIDVFVSIGVATETISYTFGG